MNTVCGYCGVGCIFKFDNNKLLGMGCKKGLSQLQSIDTDNRLKSVKYRADIKNNFQNISYEEAIKIVANKIENTSKDKIGFYLSGQLLNEDYYVANKLVKGFIGTNNVDTNSRTCMASAVVAYKKTLGADFVPLKMEDIFSSNLLILCGANVAESHIVFFNQIKKAKKNGLKVVVIDPRYTKTAKIADIYLPIKIGSDIEFFNLLSKHIIEQGFYDKTYTKTKLNGFEKLKTFLDSLNSDELLIKTSLSKELFNKFLELYFSSQNIITAWTMGLNQSSQGVDKNLTLLNTHLLTGKIFKKGNGPLSLTGQPNAMGGREVGGLATMLGVHLGFDEESIKKVSKFWDTNKIDNKVGISATNMLNSNLDMLIIVHTDPIYHLPNRNKNEKLLNKIPFVVEINAYSNTQTSKYANLQIPALPWGEKEGTATNLDRRVTLQRVLKEPTKGIKPDWKIFCDIASELGFKKYFNFSSPKDIFDEYKQMTKLNGYMDIYKIDYEKLKTQPYIWGEEIKEYLTNNKKGNLFCVENLYKSEQPSAKYPFILLTGRVKNSWHSGTKTSNIKQLQEDYKFVSISPIDAKELNIEQNDMVQISSIRGNVMLKADITDEVQPKNLFISIANLDINYLTSDILDPLSLEPDYNHSAVKILKIKDSKCKN